MKKLEQTNSNYKKYYPLILVAILLIADTAFAVEDASQALTPILTKITSSLSGTFGKIVMSIGLGLSAIAGFAGMSKAVVLTPVGVGLLLVNAEVIIKWMFG